MSNSDEQKEEAGGAEPCSSPKPLPDPNIICKALIAKLIDKNDGPSQPRLKRKSKPKKNNSGNDQRSGSVIEISEDESNTSSGPSSPAPPNAPRPFEKSNFLYEKKSKKKYKQEKEDWWRDDDVQREKRLPDTGTDHTYSKP
ncbi:uncharacterized protein LOC125076274 [Vanessa atalanta]|uniref:uncharacterized protein LOC125076274 n=1 Tax=Vanessa atalanta TaxID=42275 RepID=UPI001FCD20C8|nr:uncharacterized protein LOC125076274 [Vanessa atalanta]